jgi:N-acetylglucosaminyldiphosphoundecaprenol N-acetyl-beta-D-mannosaminyltransferase
MIPDGERGGHHMQGGQLRQQRPEVFGVPLDPTTVPGAAESILALVDAAEGGYVCVRDVHGVVLCQDDPDLLAIHQSAAMVTTDGMPLVWTVRRRGFAGASRVYGPDLMLEVCGRRVGILRHFLFGSTPAALDDLQAGLRGRFPGIHIVGAHSPPFSEAPEAGRSDAAELLGVSEADIVWVGLSTPKQERWMASSTVELAPAVLIGVGAAFDFLAGHKPQAPNWMMRSGLEWLFRALSEPRRLGRRYLMVIPRYLLMVAARSLRPTSRLAPPRPSPPEQDA